MYKIHQFKPALYVLLILGLSGFAIAAQEPGLWALSVGLVLVHAGLVYRDRFKPISRLLSNVICLLALVYMVMQFRSASEPPVLVIGQFLVVLHLVTLFSHRSNRDYGVLLVLSVLLVVASGITTASLAFGILFVVYIFLSIYCYLLLHLKREADRAIAAQPVPPDRFNLANLRQDQRYLPRSMRKLIVFITMVSSCSAVFVFLFFPRGAGTGILGQMQMRQPEVLTGFSDEAQFNQLARITQNDTPVATVSVWRRTGRADEQAITNGSLRLRGVTFDQYLRGKDGEWKWEKSAEADNPHLRIEHTASAADPLIIGAASKLKAVSWRQEVLLDPIGSKALFALAGMRKFAPRGDVKIVYNPNDESLQREDGSNSSLQYTAISNGVLTPPPPIPPAPPGHERLQILNDAMVNSRLPQLSKNIDPAIARFARDPQVSGDIAKQRPQDQPLSDLDEQIAANIENYLKTRFTYTLDLSDATEMFAGKDPLAVFVSQVHRGHCEFFAGAMTLACQSLGIRARMVFGFVTDEYNSVGEFFQVRQSHAHAWVEVLTPNHGWVVFDPTSGRELSSNQQRSLVQRIRHVVDWLELKWATSVIAYDGSRRTSLIQTLDASLMNSTYRGAVGINHWRQWWNRLNLLQMTAFWSISIKILVTAITCVLLALIVAIGWFVLERRRIRRRAAKIGLQSLPIPQQLRLARQLGFYEQMNELLQMHRIIRRPHMTAREFSHSLTYLPTEAYKLVDAMTRIFYRVRYGGADVPADQQRRLALAVDRLAEQLARYVKIGSLK